MELVHNFAPKRSTLRQASLRTGAPTLGGQVGQELPLKVNSFHLSYLLKGHFPSFSRGKPPYPQFNIYYQEINIRNIFLWERV